MPTACCGYVDPLGTQSAEHECCYCRDAGRVQHIDQTTGRKGLVICPRCYERFQAGEEAKGYVGSWLLARLPREFWERGVDGIRADSHRKAASIYLAKWPPKKAILMLSGNVGSGKSSMAAAILREVKTRHHRLGRWYSVPSLLARFRATMGDDANETSQQVSSELDLAPLIVLDDLGAEKSTEWAGEQLYIAIDRRYGRMAPMIVTSNLSPEQLDPRIASRLQHQDYATVVRFSGTDRRIR